MKSFAFGAALASLALPGVAQEASISAENNILSIVNVLTPNDGISVAQVQSSITRGIKEEISGLPGFISASVHTAVNPMTKTQHVVIYAQWESQEAANGSISAVQSGNAPIMAELFTLATATVNYGDVTAVILPPK